VRVVFKQITASEMTYIVSGGALNSTHSLMFQTEKSSDVDSSNSMTQSQSS